MKVDVTKLTTKQLWELKTKKVWNTDDSDSALPFQQCRVPDWIEKLLETYGGRIYFDPKEIEEELQERRDQKIETILVS